MTTYLEAVKDVEGLGFTVFASATDWTVGLITAIYDNGVHELMGKIYIENAIDGQEIDESNAVISWI
jgi:hypothetical protein